VIGVVSRGAVGCKAPVFSDVASRADWLQNEAIAAARAAGQQPPTWACDDTHSCAVPRSDDPKASCAFAPAAPNAGARYGWLSALALLWLRRRGLMSIRPKR
jgi:hypothetical protein